MTSSPARQVRADGLSKLNAALAGKFEALKSMGDSGTCAHYLARDLARSESCSPESGDQVMLKVLSRSAACDPRQLELFHLEAEAASKLQHNSIARTGQVTCYEGIYCAAVEHRPRAKTLRHLLDSSGWFDPGLAISLTRQIASALDYAREREVLHLRLSPDVVLVEPCGTVFITDFGIGSQSDLSWAHKERSKLASVRYISSEQAKGDDLDYRSDLYSVGVLLFEMMTDRTPFDLEDPVSIKRKLMVQSPMPPHVYRANVPQFLSAIVMELLEKQPDARIQSVPILISLLDRLDLSEGAADRLESDNGRQAAEEIDDSTSTTLGGEQEEIIFLVEADPSASGASAEEHNEDLPRLVPLDHTEDVSVMPDEDRESLWQAEAIIEIDDNPDEWTKESSASALDATPNSSPGLTPMVRLQNLAGILISLIGKAISRMNRLRSKGHAALFIAAILIPVSILALVPTDRLSDNSPPSPASSPSSVPNAEPEPSKTPSPPAETQGEAAPGKDNRRAESKQVSVPQNSRPKKYVRRPRRKTKKSPIRRHRKQSWWTMLFRS